MANTHPEIIAISAAMPDGTGLSSFQKEHPSRFFDVGIAEQHAVTFAAGQAINGMRPVVAIYSSFLQRAYDQIVHDVCRQNLPVLFAIDRAGLVGEDGDTHHGVFDISYLRHVPNLTFMAPKNTDELKYMIDFAFQTDGPVAIRYPKSSTGVAEDLPSYPLQSLRWETLINGQEIAILAVGSMVDTALQTASLLRRQGLNPTVINARIIKPIDYETLNQLFDTHSLLWVTMEDNIIEGGFGSSINEYAMFNSINIRVRNIGVPNMFIEHGTIRELRESLQLDPVSLAMQISSMIGKETYHEGFPKGTH